MAQHDMDSRELQLAARELSRDNIHRDRRVAALSRIRQIVWATTDPILVVVTSHWDPSVTAYSWQLCHLVQGEAGWVPLEADEGEWAFEQEQVRS